MNETPEKVSRIDNHKFAREHAEVWKIIKYFGMGFIGMGPELGAYLGFARLFSALSVTLPNFFLFNVMAKNIDADPRFTVAAMVYAGMVSTFVGQTIAFILNRKVTFRANNNPARAYALTAAMTVFTIIANAFLVPMTIGVFKLIPFFSEGLAQTIGKTVAMAWPNLWLYPMGRFVIHRVKKDKTEEA